MEDKAMWVKRKQMQLTLNEVELSLLRCVLRSAIHGMTLASNEKVFATNVLDMLKD